MKRRRGLGGRAAKLLAAVAVLAVGAYVLSNTDTADLARQLFAPGAEVDLAASPTPRVATASAAATPPATTAAPLTPMAAAVNDDNAGAAEAWPALAPSALLEQSAAVVDRSLKALAFDRPPRQRYARPFAAPDGRPLVAILVTGLGDDRAVAAAAVAGLPPDVTLSFDPKAPELADWIAAARAFGHEAMLDLPMQSKDGTDVGANGLLIGLNDAEMARRIDALADSGAESVGFAAAGGDALLLDEHATASALAEIARLGRAFIDTSGEPMSQASVAAGTAGLAFARSMVQLDAGSSRTALTERLAVLAQTAIEHGSALASARASPTVIVSIADWARRQTGDGPVLAPASALLKP
jgi:polysaccharide deacetylase 2 family uncharacterized protein YibQ